MVFVPVPNTVLVEMRFLCDGERVENTLHYRKVAGWDSASMTQLAAELKSVWSSFIQPIVPGAVSLREIVVTKLDTPSDLQVTYATGLPLSGTALSALMPNNVTLCISLRTGYTGRSARGRNYFIGLTKDAVVDNEVIGTVQDTLLAYYDELRDSPSAFGAIQVIVQKFANKAPLSQGFVRDVTSAVIVDATVDSQRRRLPGRGQ